MLSCFFRQNVEFMIKWKGIKGGKMISANIKNLRKEKGFTQKDLADLLHVTSQAVSRWEQGEVEPSLDTIVNIAKIFSVTTDEIIYGPESKPKPEVVTEVKEKIIVEQAKPVLTICENCKRPIYKSEEIVTQTKACGRGKSSTHYICADCDKKIKEQERKAKEKYAKTQRKKSYIFSSIIAGVVLFSGIIYANTQNSDGRIITLAILLSIFTYTFVACLFLKNNFLGEAFMTIASWGFVKFPGLIFSFSLEGFAWLIGIKILFGLLGILIAIAAIAIALAICMILSIIVYPFALLKSYNHPERTETV